MYQSNWHRVLEFNLHEATEAKKKLQPLLTAREQELEIRNAEAAIANENLRDVSLLMAAIKQRQAELLEDRFSTDEEIEGWLARHQ